MIMHNNMCNEWQTAVVSIYEFYASPATTKYAGQLLLGVKKGTEFPLSLLIFQCLLMRISILTSPKAGL
jgi:hypothetical protein